LGAHVPQCAAPRAIYMRLRVGVPRTSIMDLAWREAERLLGPDRFADWDDNRDGTVVGKITFYRAGTPRPQTLAEQDVARGGAGPAINDRVLELPTLSTPEATGVAIADTILQVIQDTMYVRRDGRALFATIAQYSGSFRDPQLFCFLSHIDGETRPFGGAAAT
jgi:hypothetical protein